MRAAVGADADLVRALMESLDADVLPRSVDAASVVRDAVEAFRPHADELGVTLTIDAPGAVPADLDPERLGQIVANLVENALKYARTSVSVATRDTTSAMSLFASRMSSAPSRR